MKQEFINIALSKIGTKEGGKNNTGEAIAEFQKATWLTPGAWPWCCAFVCWCLRELLKKPEAQKHFSLAGALAVDKFRCKGANTGDWLTWARKHNFTVLGPSDLAKAGDIVIFDFNADKKNDHIAIVGQDQIKNTDFITTIEGNTNGAGSADGDGVYKKARKPKLVTHYIRIWTE